MQGKRMVSLRKFVINDLSASVMVIKLLQRFLKPTVPGQMVCAMHGYCQFHPRTIEPL